MQHITAQDLKDRLANGEKLNILDVREPHEFVETNMGGLLLPLGKIQTMQVEDIEDWKNEEIIIHCKSGVRSQNACLILAQIGFANTVNLTGGILAFNALK
jgi:rhodanese-related sulfurtransferase